MTCLDFKGDFSALPSAGEALDRFHEGNSEYLRGGFPIQDVARNRVGAIFVARDITSFYVSMRRTDVMIAVSTVVAVLVGSGIFLLMLSRLIFRRLGPIIKEATWVAAGDYGTEIKVSSEGEVGQLEQLFEQFRQIFMDVLSHIPDMQQK